MEGADDAAIRFIVNVGSMITSKALVGVFAAIKKVMQTGVKTATKDFKKGDVGLKNLTYQGDPLEKKEGLQITDVGRFKREFKKHGVKFALKNNGNGTYEFFFKAKNHATVEYALGQIVDKELKKAQKLSTKTKHKLPQKQLEGLSKKEQAINRKSTSNSENLIYDETKKELKAKPNNQVEPFAILRQKQAFLEEVQHYLKDNFAKSKYAKEYDVDSKYEFGLAPQDADKFIESVKGHHLVNGQYVSKIEIAEELGLIKNAGYPDERGRTVYEVPNDIKGKMLIIEKDKQGNVAHIRKADKTEITFKHKVASKTTKIPKAPKVTR